MTEITENKTDAVPQAENVNEAVSEDTTPKAEHNEAVVSVKYNKEIRNLSIEEATALAQKGLKYSSIEKEYAALKEMASEDKKSVPEFIESLKNQRLENRKQALVERCNGDTELAEHIFELEKTGNDTDDGFTEITEYFPKIKSRDDLPDEVLENSKLKGTLLLDEYLRYRLSEEQNRKQTELRQAAADMSGTGSQLNRSEAVSPETAEFLKGLWK